MNTVAAVDRAAADTEAAHARGVPARGTGATDATVSVGMAIALGALAMTFAAVLLAYGIVRVQAASWPPPGEPPPPSPWPWPLTATAAALAGSGALAWAQRRAAAAAAATGMPGLISAPPRLGRALTLTAAMGVTFIAVQIAGWCAMARAGFRPDSGIVASVVYALTMFHALHALAALLVLAPLLVRAMRGRPVRRASLAAVASFWHLVTIVWLVVLLAVFVA